MTYLHGDFTVSQELEDSSIGIVQKKLFYICV